MAGFAMVQRVHRLEKQLADLGMQWGNDRHGSYGGMEHGERVAVFPDSNDGLPIYNRDAQLFTGTIEQVEVWLAGIEWSRAYDRMLGLGVHKRRERKEQDYRNQRLVGILKDQQPEVQVD